MVKKIKASHNHKSKYNYENSSLEIPKQRFTISQNLQSKKI